MYLPLSDLSTSFPYLQTFLPDKQPTQLYSPLFTFAGRLASAAQKEPGKAGEPREKQCRGSQLEKGRWIFFKDIFIRNLNLSLSPS